MNESTARALHRAQHDTEPDWRKPGPRDWYRGRAREREAARVGRLDAIVAANVANRHERAKLITAMDERRRPFDVILNELIRRELFSGAR